MITRICSFFILFVMALLPQGALAQDFHFDEVTYTPQQTVFKLFAPKNAKNVVVEWHAMASPKGKMKRVPPKRFKQKMKLGNDGIWSAKVNGDLNHFAYRFFVDDNVSPGVFAKAVTVNGQNGVILDMKETNPDGWESDRRPQVKSPADLVIYEMHHRDFSIDPSSGIIPEHRGKYLALTEEKAIRHLKELGVNAIHILPSYDYGSVDETRLDQPQYNWGYDPVNYNVPEGSYSTDPYTPATRIREFKQMVQALHKAGIRVILDVVYNHTYDIDHSNFQRTYPDYYYRKEQGKYSNGSGCGNETASEQPMMRKFMIESVKYWINEYHIDGFRFDLMGVHDIPTMNAIRKAVDEIDPSIFIYGEGWSAGACALPAEQLAVKAHITQLPRIAAFSDEIRDALRGPFSDDTQGALLAGIFGDEESVKAGITGMIDHPQVDYSLVNYTKEPWALQPTQMISYVSCHDDMCLTDRLRSSIPGIKTDELIRLDLLAQTAVMLSQGVPFMLSGEEMLRDKKGVHNSFESPDSVNHLDWGNLNRYPQVFEYYKKLIALRKNHPAFRLGDSDLVRKHLEFFVAPKGVITFHLGGHAGGDAWEDIIVILNFNKDAQKVDILEEPFTVVCRDGVIDENGLGEVCTEQVEVAGQTAMVLKK